MTMQDEELKQEYKCEAVGVFDDLEDMQEAISDLELNGLDRRQISVRGSEWEVEGEFGMTHVPTKMMEDNPRTPRSPNVKIEEVALGQGALISAGILIGAIMSLIVVAPTPDQSALIVTATGAGFGAIIGALLAKILGDKYIEFFERQIEDGGLLVWVNIPDFKMGDKVKTILQRHGAHDVHIHTVST